MRGTTPSQFALFTVINLDARIPAQHPIRAIKALAEPILKTMNKAFSAMYAREGRPSIPPEQLLKATLLMALYSIRSERQFCERLEYDLLFRWFLDLSLEDAAFDHSVFSKNRQRMLAADVAEKFLRQTVLAAREHHLISQEHFTVDGTLIEAWASMKSFRPKDGQPGGGAAGSDMDKGNPSVDFHGQTRSNQTHASTTDPEARLAKKSKGAPAILGFQGNALMENRHGLCIDITVCEPHASASERQQALAMLGRCRRRGARPKTVGADKAYDDPRFVRALRRRGIVAHVAQNIHARHASAIDRRTTRHAGYEVSQRIRKRIEELFGWCKTVGGMRKSRYRGIARTQFHLRLVAAAYNLTRMAKLCPQPA
jgi:transposase